MRYNRLITFGDSFTFGHGLADCYISPIHPGRHPSKIGWVNKLAAKLNINEIYNYSSPGASNRLITHRIFNIDEFTEKDLVICQFTFYERDFYYNNEGGVINVGTWNIDPSKPENCIEFWEYYLNRGKEETIHRSFELFSLSALYLLTKPCTTYAMVTPQFEQQKDFKSKHPDGILNHYEMYTSPANRNKFIEVTFPIVEKFFNAQKHYRDTTKFKIEHNDYALDNLHYGPKSQKFLSERLAEEIRKTHYPNI